MTSLFGSAAVPAVRLDGRVSGAEPRTVERAPSTAGAMASRTNEGSVHTTSGNDRRTGRRRAAASPARRRPALASSVRRSRTGASGSPSRTAVPERRHERPGRCGRSAALSSARASANPAPRCSRCSRAWNPGRTGGGAIRASSPIAWVGVKPACRHITSSSMASGIAASIATAWRRSAWCRRRTAIAPTTPPTPTIVIAGPRAAIAATTAIAATPTITASGRASAVTEALAASRTRRQPHGSAAPATAALTTTIDRCQPRHNRPRRSSLIAARPMIWRIHSAPATLSTAPSVTTATPAGVPTAARTLGSVSGRAARAGRSVRG